MIDRIDPFALRSDNGSIADIRELAATEIEPIPIEKFDELGRRLSEPAWSEELYRDGVILRCAYVLLGRGKDELIKGARELKGVGPEDSPLVDLLDDLRETAKRLDDFKQAAELAQARLLVAAAALAVEGAAA